MSQSSSSYFHLNGFSSMTDNNIDNIFKEKYESSMLEYLNRFVVKPIVGEETFKDYSSRYVCAPYKIGIRGIMWLNKTNIIICDANGLLYSKEFASVEISNVCFLINIRNDCIDVLYMLQCNDCKLDSFSLRLTRMKKIVGMLSFRCDILSYRGGLFAVHNWHMYEAEYDGIFFNMLTGFPDVGQPRWVWYTPDFSQYVLAVKNHVISTGDHYIMCKSKLDDGVYTFDRYGACLNLTAARVMKKDDLVIMHACSRMEIDVLRLLVSAGSRMEMVSFTKICEMFESLHGYYDDMGVEEEAEEIVVPVVTSNSGNGILKVLDIRDRKGEKKRIVTPGSRSYLYLPFEEMRQIHSPKICVMCLQKNGTLTVIDSDPYVVINEDKQKMSVGFTMRFRMSNCGDPDRSGLIRFAVFCSCAECNVNVVYVGDVRMMMNRSPPRIKKAESNFDEILSLGHHLSQRMEYFKEYWREKLFGKIEIKIEKD